MTFLEILNEQKKKEVEAQKKAEQTKNESTFLRLVREQKAQQSAQKTSPTVQPVESAAPTVTPVQTTAPVKTTAPVEATVQNVASLLPEPEQNAQRQQDEAVLRSRMVNPMDGSAGIDMLRAGMKKQTDDAKAAYYDARKAYNAEKNRLFGYDAEKVNQLSENMKDAEEKYRAVGGRPITAAEDVGNILDMSNAYKLSALVDEADLALSKFANNRFGANIDTSDVESRIAEMKAAQQGETEEIMSRYNGFGQLALKGVNAAYDMLGDTALLYASGVPAALGKAAPALSAAAEATAPGIDPTRLQKATTLVKRFGAKAVDNVASSVTNAAVSMRSGLNAYSDAILSGASDEQASRVGFENALLEYFSNKMFGGNPVEDADRGYVSKLVGLIVDRIGNEQAVKDVLGTTGGKVFTALMDKVGEGLEEVITGIGDPLIEKYNYNPEARIDPNALLEDFSVGVVMSVLLGVPVDIARTLSSVNNPAEQPIDRIIPTSADPQQNAAEILPAPDNPPLQTTENRGNMEEQRPSAPQQNPAEMLQQATQPAQQNASEALPEPVQNSATEMTRPVGVQPTAETDRLAAQALAAQDERPKSAKNVDVPENHIDNRDFDTVGKRNVNAFQFDNPQLHPYFAKAAQVLKNDAENSIGLGTMMQHKEVGKHRTMRYVAPKSTLLDEAQNVGISRPEIIKACEAIINDSGQENYAVAKRVELILDEMLTKGYTTSYGEAFESDSDYIRAKGGITGGKSELETELAKYDEQYDLVDALETPDAEELARREKERDAIRAKYAQQSESDRLAVQALAGQDAQETPEVSKTQRTQKPGTVQKQAEEKPAPTQLNQNNSAQTKAENPQQQISDELQDYLKGNKEFAPARLFEIADKAFGGTMASGAYTVKDAYDGMELAVNQFLMNSDVIKNANGNQANARMTIKRMEKILSALPTMTKRTAESDAMQQFSTPPNIAYTAAWIANINPQDVVLEPSAGIGGLALWPKAWGATVYGNELSRRRIAFLNQLGLDGTFNYNAEQIDNLLPESVKPSVVLMNPPFSSSATMSAKDTTNATKHIEQALYRLQDGGRLIAVVGKGMSADAPRFKPWFDELKKRYNVRANIGIDGSNYRKYGTTYDVQIIVIDKTAPTGAETKTGFFKDLTEIPAEMEEIRNDRERTYAMSGRSDNNVSGRAGTVPERAEGNQKPGRQSDSVGERTGGGAESEGENGRVHALSGRENDGGRGAARLGRDNETGENRPAESDIGHQRSGVVQSNGRSSSAGSGKLGGKRDVLTVEKADGSTKLSKSDASNVESVYSTYKPQKVRIHGAMAHPAKLVESAAMAAVPPPDPTYAPALPASIATDGILSDAQLENVVYAGQAHSQIMPNGERKGYFIGDGTGVGKGRQISGIIRDNFLQGRTKAIWVSEKTDLYTDAVRDWTDLGGSKDDVISVTSGSKDKRYQIGGKGKDRTFKIEAPSGIAYTTYKQLSVDPEKKLKMYKEWLGADFDGVIALDEAHNMGNSIGRGAAKTALAGIELQNAFPKARVVYASATGASDVTQYGYLKRLGLWGRGTSFRDVNDFVTRIQSGGLAAMEVVARDMKAMGVYMARSISYDDVRYETIEQKLTRQQRDIYNASARAWQVALNNIQTAMKLTNQNLSGQARGYALGRFYTSEQRFFNQVLTSMSVPAMLDRIQEDLDAGKSVVIQLTNTNEAQMNRAIAANAESGGDLDELDLSPSEMLADMVMSAFPIQQYEEYEDENGNVRSRPVVTDDGEPVINREAVRRRDALIDDLRGMSLPESPLDLILNTFGANNVAEVTGRGRRVIEVPNERGEIERKIERRDQKAAGTSETAAFQNGEKRILVFSEAGGTGRSYHADLRAKNQQQRVHYLLQAGWNSQKAVQGFGRTHRSNQASAPVFRLVTTDVMGQKRFTSTIARRLDQLGALTKGQRQAGSGVFGEKDNLENPIATDALYTFLKTADGEDRASIEKLGLKLYDSKGHFIEDGDARNMPRFLNRILALEVDEQNRLFSDFFDVYDRVMDDAIRNGTVDAGLESIKADKAEVTDRQVINKTPDGAETEYVQLKVYNKPNIIPFNRLKTLHSNFKGLIRLDDGSVRAVYETRPETNARTGEVVQQYKLESPHRGHFTTRNAHTLETGATWIDEADYKAAWNEEIAKLPEYDVSVQHLLTGTLLPVWDKLPATGARIRRVVTTDGTQYLGRLISGDSIDGVLRNFGTQSAKQQYSTKELVSAVMKNGKEIVLRNDGQRIKAVRVSGDKRIEITGRNLKFLPRYYDGVFMERIDWQERYFIPTGERAEQIISEIVKDNPVRDVAESGDDVSYSKVRTGSTAQKDAEYLELAKDPEKNAERLQKMVDEAAMEAGFYPPKLYHGTKPHGGNGGFGFTSFDMKRNAGHIFATTNQNAAKYYSGGADVKKISEAETIKPLFGKPKLVGGQSGVYSLYGKLGKSLEIDNHGRAWNDIERPEELRLFINSETTLTDEIAEAAGRAGYDSVVIKNVKDSNTMVGVSDDYIFFNAENVRSADPVTYDDKGKVIPLSLRFKSGGDDIRYSKTAAAQPAPNKDNWTATRTAGGDRNKQAKPVSEIIEGIRHDFGFNITTGHVRGAGIVGLFNRRDKGIRQKFANDLPTICHELGHALDDRYSILKHASKDVKSELERALGSGKDLYPEKKWASEGFAEYLRKYLTNSDNAETEFPEATQLFKESLSGRDLALIEALADDVNAALSLDADSAESSIRLREDKPYDFRTHEEKIRDMGDSVYQAWIDSNHGLKLAERAMGGNGRAYILATNSAYSDGIAGRILEGDLTDADGKYVAPGLKSALHGVNLRDRAEYLAFNEYLVVRHGPERLAQGKDVFADPRKNSEEWMIARRAVLESKYPAFEAAATRLIEFERKFNEVWGVGYGLISGTVFDKWGEMYENHVPLNRAVDKGGTGARRGYANQSSPYRRAKGSGRDIVAPVDNIIDEIVRVVNTAVRNNVMLELRKAALSEDADANFMEKIPTPLRPNSVNISNVKEKLSDAVSSGVENGTIEGASADNIDEVISSLDDVFLQFQKQNPRGDIITIMVGGKPEYWKINDPVLLESVTNMTMPKLKGFMEAYGTITRFMTANITGNNAVWSIFSNAPRDAATFATYFKDKKQIFKAFANVGSSYINAFRENYSEKAIDPLYAEYIALGGGRASAYSADRDLAKKAREKLTSSKAQRVLDAVNPINAVSFITDTIEMGPRFATYKTLREAGLDPQEAFYEAMDITVNFRRGGSRSRAANKLFPFFNASVQGMDKFARYFTAEDMKDTGKSTRSKAVRSRWTMFLGASAVLAAINFALNQYDDDKEKDYAQLSSYTKNSYFVIPLGDGKYFAIPKPRELAVITSLLSAAAQSVFNKDDHAFDEFYGYVVDQFFPNVISDLLQLPANISQEGTSSGISSTVADMIGDAGIVGVAANISANRDFLGRPIESAYMQYYEPRDRWSDNTSKIAYWMGQAFNLSPTVIDYFGNQVLGYIWKYQKALFPVGESYRDWTLGVKNSYVKDNEYSTDLVNWLYDAADKSARKAKSDSENMDKQIAAKMDARMTDFYSTFNKLNKGNTSTAEKRIARQCMLDTITEYRKSSEDGTQTAAQKAVYDVIRKTGDTSLLPSVMSDKVKNADGNAFALDDGDYYEFQTRYLAFYYSYAEENLHNATTPEEKAKILKAAKSEAKDRATELILRRVDRGQYD